jgi:hypothetical protein
MAFNEIPERCQLKISLDLPLKFQRAANYRSLNYMPLDNRSLRHHTSSAVLFHFYIFLEVIKHLSFDGCGIQQHWLNVDDLWIIARETWLWF